MGRSSLVSRPAWHVRERRCQFTARWGRLSPAIRTYLLMPQQPEVLVMTSDDGPPMWMTLDEVAEYLRLSRSKLYDLAQGGEIPCSKVAGRWRSIAPRSTNRCSRSAPGRRTRRGGNIVRRSRGIAA